MHSHREARHTILSNFVVFIDDNKLVKIPVELKQLESLPEQVSQHSAGSTDYDEVEAFLQKRLGEFGLALDFSGTDRDLDVFPQAYDRGCFGILRSKDEIVGTFALFPVSIEMAEIRKMYLAPSLRGQRIGSGMLEALEDYARRSGFTRLELETATPMEDAIRLYRRKGYLEMPQAGCGDRCDRRFFKELR